MYQTLIEMRLTKNRVEIMRTWFNNPIEMIEFLAIYSKYDGNARVHIKPRETNRD